MASRSVLLVEDNYDNLAIYSTFLRHVGYEVLEAIDGQAALDMARDLRPGVILMDVSIPIIDGWEATRRLKADPATAHIPVVALTAHALTSDREMAAAVGCAEFIPKPAEPVKVAEAVKRYLDEPDSVTRLIPK
jgi:CheY-like chemotaxis protein